MIHKWLKKQGYTLPDDGMSAKQKEWLAWYRGYVQDRHKYTVYDGQQVRECSRRTLGMAKVVCEDYASLLMNENVQISAEGFGELPEVLEENNFMTRMNRLSELTMALGTGAIVEFLVDDRPVIDYIRAEYVYPLSWDNDKVEECAFASRKVISRNDASEEVYYVQLHTKVNGGWQIRNVYLDHSGNEMELPDGMVEETPVSPVPLFQIVRPNTINVADFDSPLGASVFSEALEQLFDCDVVWDSYINEFILGKKRMMIPTSLSKMLMHKDANGNELLSPMFDPNDALFYVYDAEDGAAQKPIEVDMNLRTDAHDQGLQRCIDMVSKKCGLGMGRYKIESNDIKTATEVISSKSDLYQSLKRHEKTFGDAIIGMVRALAWLTGRSPEIAVSVKFDDSIIEDEQAALDRCVKMVNNGLMSHVEAIMRLENVDENEAKRRYALIAQEQATDIDETERAMLRLGTGGGL